MSSDFFALELEGPKAQLEFLVVFFQIGLPLAAQGVIGLARYGYREYNPEQIYFAKRMQEEGILGSSTFAFLLGNNTETGASYFDLGGFKPERI